MTGGGAGGRPPRPIPGAVVLLTALVATLLAALPTGAQTGPIRAQARVEPRVVGLDGYALLVLTIEGPGYEAPRLVPRFELENLEVQGESIPEQGIRVGSAGTAWSYSWTFVLTPEELGPALVHQIRIRAGGTVLELPPERLEVVAEAPLDQQPPPPPRRRASDRLRQLLERFGDTLPERAPREPRLFLRSEVVPAQPYVGQPVRYVTFLYTQTSVSLIEPDSLPSFRGFWVRPVEVTQSRAEVEVDGELYTRAPIFERVVIPLGAGWAEIEPLATTIEVEGRRRVGFFASEPVRAKVQRASQTVRFQVLPRPAPGTADGSDTEAAAGAVARDRPLHLSFPGSLGTPVGPLQIDARLEPDTLPADGSATLTVELTGEGYLEGLAPPTVRAPRGLRLLEPQELAIAPPDDGRRMRAGWRFAVVPETPGTYELPPVTVDWFDPVTEGYRTAEASLGTLTVLAPPPPVAPAALDPEPATQGTGPWLPRRLWGPLALGIAGLLGLLVLAVLWRRRSAGGLTTRGLFGGGDPHHHRQLAAFDDALGRAAAEDRPRRAAFRLEDAWRQYLAAGWSVPDDLAPRRWPQALAERGVGDERARDLDRLVEDLRSLRTAPELADTEALAGELARRSKALARRLDRPTAT